MVEFKWIKPCSSLFLLLVLQFQAVITGQDSHLTVRDGDGVTLPCKYALKNQKQCNGTTWLFVSSHTSRVVELIRLGQIGERAQAQSDILSVTADCSLAIKKAGVTEAGHYTCRQYNELQQQQGPDSVAYLSVINIHESKDRDKVKLSCSVLTYERCTHTVQWLYEGNKDNIANPGSSCSAHVTFETSSPKQKSARCKVTDGNGRSFLLCSPTPQSSCEGTDESKGNTNGEGDLAPPADDDGPAKQQDPTPHWWVYVTVAVGLAAILVTVGVLVRQRKNKGNKAPRDGSTGLSLNPAVTQSAPPTSQDTDDPEDVVPYASISYSKRTNGTAQVQQEDDGDESDAVTYNSVNVSPGDSPDPSSLYATVNKSKKKHDVAV